MALTRPKYSQIYDTDWKQSVEIASTVDVGNLILGNTQPNSVDGVTVLTNWRVLVKDQTNGAQNGIYVVRSAGTGSNGWWTRSLDALTSDRVTAGLTVAVISGSINGGKEFRLTTPDPITLGTTVLTFIDPNAAAGAGGANAQVQFNDTSTLAGSAGFTFNKFSNAVSVAGSISTANISVNGNVSATRFFGDGSQLTGIDSTSIQNSTNSFVITYANGNVTVKGNLVPSANLVYDLGSPTQRWATGYFAGNTLDLGGAQISVNAVTGTFTFTGNGVSTNLGGTSTFNPPGNVNIGGNLFVSGAVYIAGNTTTISTNNVVFNDSLIYLADGNPTDFLDIGFVGNFTRSSLYQHTGFARDATDGVWKLFEGVEPEPTTVIDFGSASYSTALIGNLVTRSNVTIGGNTRLGGALLNSAGLGGIPGQLLQSTGTGLTWVDLDISTLSNGIGSTTVTAEASNVNVTVNTTAIASFGDTGLVVNGDMYATQFIGNGLQLTGAINTTGNILGTAGTLNSLTVNGSTNVLGFSNITVASGSADSALVIMGNVSKGGASYHDFLRVTSTASGIANPSVHFRLNIHGNLQMINSGYTAQLFELRQNGTVIVTNDILPSANNVSNIGSATSKFRIIHAQATQAQYADLAEVYTSDQPYPAGTVVVFGGSAEVMQSHSSHDPRIAGVVSTNPAYLMNSTETGVPVALQGRVPCRVLGPVSQGDRVVSSHIAGVAQALDPVQYQPGCIIGKALQAIDSTEISTIEVVVGRV